MILGIILVLVLIISVLISKRLIKKYAGTTTLLWIGRMSFFIVTIFLVTALANEFIPSIHMRNMRTDIQQFELFDVFLLAYVVTFFVAFTVLLNYCLIHWIKSKFTLEIFKYMWIVALFFPIYIGEEYPEYRIYANLTAYYLVISLYYYSVIEKGWLLVKKTMNRDDL